MHIWAALEDPDGLYRQYKLSVVLLAMKITFSYLVSGRAYNVSIQSIYIFKEKVKNTERMAKEIFSFSLYTILNCAGAFKRETSNTEHKLCYLFLKKE